jgi:hypothetical protein
MEARLPSVELAAHGIFATRKAAKPGRIALADSSLNVNAVSNEPRPELNLRPTMPVPGLTTSKSTVYAVCRADS